MSDYECTVHCSRYHCSFYDPSVRSYSFFSKITYLSLSNDEHSFTAVFIHQPPFPMTDSHFYRCLYCFPPPNMLSNDKHSFTAIFHLSNDEHSFTAIFIHQPPFPTTNTLLQPFFTTIHAFTRFSTTSDSFQQQKLFYSRSPPFQRRSLVYSHLHPPTSLSNYGQSFSLPFYCFPPPNTLSNDDEHSFTAIFIHQPPSPSTNTLLQPFSTTIHAFQ
jgi:hypothetical protein